MTRSQLDTLRRAALQRRTPARKLLLLLGALAVATAARWLLDRGAYGLPFLTFYPVVLLAALFLGGRYAVLGAVLALAIARFGFTEDPWHLANPSIRAVMFVLYCGTIGIFVVTGHFVRQILIESQTHIIEAEAFNAELQHRAKNALQILRALIGRAPSEGEDLATFQAKVLGRMEALGKANELLRYGSLEMVSLAELVATATAPFDRARFRCSGPAAQVHKSGATPLVMALHELATNALKYGALSVEAGQVDIAWAAGEPGAVALEWHEVGGPAVAPPASRGFGSRLLRPHGGLHAVRLEWEPAGLICRMDLVGRLSPPQIGPTEPLGPSRRGGIGRWRYTAP